MGQKRKVVRNIMLRLYEDEPELLEIFNSLQIGMSATTFIKQAVLFYANGQQGREADSLNEEQTSLILQTLDRLNRNTDELYKKIKSLDLTGISELAAPTDQNVSDSKAEDVDTQGKIESGIRPGTDKAPAQNTMDDVMGFLNS